MARRPSTVLLAVLALAFLGGLVAIRVQSSRSAAAIAPRAGASTPGVASPEPGAPVRGPGFVGVIVAGGSVDVSPRQEGTLEGVDVQVGDRVKQGAVIARLDVQALRREWAVAQASLQAAEAEEGISRLALAETSEKRKRREDPKQLSLGAVSEEEVAAARYQEQTAAARLRGAEALVAQRRAQVGQIEQRLAESTVRAPFDGQVSVRYLDTGARAAPGQPVVRLLRSGVQQVRFAIPEDQASDVSVGQPVVIEVPSMRLSLRGRVENVAPEVDVASRMLLAIASLEVDAAASVPSGMAVRVRPGSGAQARGSRP